jgi:hypothetical protein
LSLLKPSTLNSYAKSQSLEIHALGFFVLSVKSLLNNSLNLTVKNA